MDTTTTTVGQAQTHVLKCWPEFFGDIIAGRKLFEVRLDDRGYGEGDKLYLEDWDPNAGIYTGRKHTTEVVYILRGPVFGLPDKHVVMGLKPPTSPLGERAAEMLRNQARTCRTLTVPWEPSEVADDLDLLADRIEALP
jgi:hypothetical protein